MKVRFLITILICFSIAASCQRAIELPGGWELKPKPPAPTPPPGPNDTVYILLIGGQSNADNRLATTSPVMEADSTVSGFTIWDNTNGGWRSFKYHVYSGAGSPSQGLWGFGEIVAKRFHDSTGKEVRVVKATAGNTAMALNGASSGSWYIPNIDVTVGARMYFRLQNRHNAAVAALNTEGVTYKVLALLWHQGEGDYTSPNQDSYQTNMQNFIAEVRTLTGNANFPIIAGTVSNLSGQYSAIVNTAQHTIDAADPNYYLVNMAGQGLFDGVHFDGTAAEYLANQMLIILRTL